MTILVIPKHFVPEVVCLDGLPIIDLSLGSLVVLELGLVLVSVGRLYGSPAFRTNLRYKEAISEASIF